MHDMKAIFLVRLCASECFDMPRFSVALKVRSKDTGFCGISGIERKLGISPAGSALSATSWDKLDWYDRTYARTIVAADTSDLDALKKLGAALGRRYKDRLRTVAIIGDPIEFYNDFAFWRRYHQVPGAVSFFRDQRYRVDRFLAAMEKISPRGNLDVIAEGTGIRNERKLLELSGIPSDGYPCDLPTPVSHSAKDVFKFYYLPKMTEILGLSDWRKITNEFEGPLTRIAPVEKYMELGELVKKHWRYAIRRYPQLERLLENDEKSYADAPEYRGYDSKKLAKLMPAGFRSHFGYLVNGFTGFQKPLFNEFSSVELLPERPKCAVLTFTYNHERFISECIESVAAQQGCDFEHVIFDDASTDGTQEIIRAYARKYPHIKPVLFRNKPGSTIGPAFQSLRNRYVALCDGDDYFTDPLKLKKQIAFLDEHPDHYVCSHFAEVRYADGSRPHTFPERSFIGERRSFGLSDILQGNFMQMCSVMYRWRFGSGLPGWFNPLLRPADWYWHVLHAEVGRIGFIPETMAVYRRHADAAYATADQGDPEKHFVRHGLRELEVFEELDGHFQGRYHKDFGILASGAFARLFTYGAKNDDFTAYENAASLFPGFEQEFRTHVSELDRK